MLYLLFHRVSLPYCCEMHRMLSTVVSPYKNDNRPLSVIISVKLKRQIDLLLQCRLQYCLCYEVISIDCMG